MTLSPPPPAPPPDFAGITQNGAASGSVVGSFDMLCLSGLIFSVLADDNFSASTGAGQSSEHLYTEVEPWPAQPENMSLRTTDSSILFTFLPAVPTYEAKIDDSLLQLSADEAVCIDSAALLLALGAFVALVLKNTAQCASPNQPEIIP